MSNNPAYPEDLRKRESEALHARRACAKIDEKHREPTTKTGRWADDVTGLGLSGGGIRSSTFNLGILQVLARKGLKGSPSPLRRIDYLSTASGGGYVGSFLGRWFDRLRGPECPEDTPYDRVEEGLTSPGSKAIEWLRKSGNYISPQGSGDVKVNIAIFVRNLLSVHFVVGMLVFALFGLANLVRYGLFDKFLTLGGFAVSQDDLPIGHLVAAALGPFFSPWFVFGELLLLFLVLPRILGYWLASQDEHERFSPPALALSFVLITLLLALAVLNGLAFEPLVLALSLIVAFFYVEDAWERGRKRQAAVGSGGSSTQRLRTRNFLTHDLGLSLVFTGGAFAFAVVDTVAHGLQEWWIGNNHTYAAAFAGFGALLAASVPVVNFLPRLFRRNVTAETQSSFVLGLKKTVVAGLLAAVLLALPLVFYSFTAHAVYQGGSKVLIGAGATLLALFISFFVFAQPRALAFVNRSSLAQVYSARLARAFLGASNPIRRRPRGANITEVMPGDDIASIRDYRPDKAGGPLHLINVVVNQTVDFSSMRGNRDRKGENLAVSGLALSVGKRWHSFWADPSGQSPPGRARLEPVGWVPGTDHPLINERGVPTDAAETMSLRRWMSISGAAVSPGSGQTTQLGTALLFGLGNFRTGWWWDSGLSKASRDGFPNLTFVRRLLYLIPRVLITQSLLLMEWIAMFPGPWSRHWYLSDGGFFENLAGYELVRRRVPRIILCDGSADPKYDLEGLANLVRKVRIDFDASIESFTPEEVKAAKLPAEVGRHVGTIDDLKPGADDALPKHAALLWVRYQDDPGNPSVLLYVKASLTDDESADVRSYHADHKDYPHESTGDQFFDEAQWESYRKLGEHVAAPLFADPSWFWAISRK